MRRDIYNCKLVFLISYCLIVTLPVFSQTREIDSLKSILKTHTQQDTIRAQTIMYFSNAYAKATNNRSKMLSQISELLPLSQKLNYKKGIAYTYLARGSYYYEINDLPGAFDNFVRALKEYEAMHDLRGIANCYNNMGIVKNDQGKYLEAIQFKEKSARFSEQLKEKKGCATAYTNIGATYVNIGNYKKALTYFFKSLYLNEELNDSLGIAICSGNIGDVLCMEGSTNVSLIYLNKSLKIIDVKNYHRLRSSIYCSFATTYRAQKKYEQALTYNFKSLEIAKESNYKKGINGASIDIGKNYLSLKRFSNAIPYFTAALKSSKELNDNVNIIECYNGLGNCYEEQNDYEQSLNCFSKALDLSSAINYKAGVKDAYENLGFVNEKLGNYKQALLYNKQYNNVKDTMLNEESFKQTSEMNIRYETDKKEKEILLLTKDQQLKDKTLKEQRLVRTGLTIGLGLLFILSFLLFNRYRFKQKANLILTQQKLEINKKNIEITDSIDYAKTIQDIVLPNSEKLNELLPQHFILYKPKDIVSGDFYWVGKKGQDIICAVADCTGHGVPGAFMSLLGHNILENVINQGSSIEPGTILTTLNEGIVTRFSKGKETSKHGMDIAIISINLINQQLQYAGARNSLYLIRNNTLTEIKADKMSTGIQKDEGKIIYTNHTVSIQKGDMLYLFSDGFADQKGRAGKKKFYYQPFKNFLTSINNLSMAEQRQQLDKTITNWMGGMEQIDDILVMGIRV